MKSILLKSLSLTNFKGIKELSLNFNKDTQILGANGSGKTTVSDAFTWLLFGKDSSDRKDFEIKTLDENNVAIPKLEHEVSAVLSVDGKEITIRKVLKEKWVKARGAETAEFSGNTTQYFWNDVEITMKEFNAKVADILDEKVFKLITSPTAFASLHWLDKRRVLTEISGGVSDEEIINGNADFEEMWQYCLSNNITIEERAKQLKGSIKKMNDDIKDIPARIDEVYRNTPEKVDETEVNKLIAQKEKEISTIDAAIQSAAKANEEQNKKIQQNQNKIFELKSEMNAIEFDAKEKAKSILREQSASVDELSRKQAELMAIEKERDANADKVQQLKDSVKNIEKSLVELRAKWNAENAVAFVFDEKDRLCPTCGNPVKNPLEKAEELRSVFNAEKKRKLDNISAEGKEISERLNRNKEIISSLESANKELTEKVKSISAELKDLQSANAKIATLDELYNKEILDNVQYSKLKIEINTLEANKFELKGEDPDLQAKRKTLFDEIIELKESIASNKLIAASEKRIDELKAEERKISAEIAKAERGLFVIEKYTKTKIDAVEKKVNDKFSFVKFKMYNQQVNGGEAETCEALIDGVPYSDTNTASKINAGIDVINVLSQHYGISAPIMIDNRESITKILPTESQTISLVVSPEHKKLTIQ